MNVVLDSVTERTRAVGIRRSRRCLLSFIFSAVLGVVFGVWPAHRAASLDPIVALRYV